MNTVSYKFSFQETYFLKNHECTTQMVTLTFLYYYLMTLCIHWRLKRILLARRIYLASSWLHSMKHIKLDRRLLHSLSKPSHISVLSYTNIITVFEDSQLSTFPISLWFYYFIFCKRCYILLLLLLLLLLWIQLKLL
jgi:hypothetical protein